MPQLDFFTFSHQYLIASLCFCGLYYFNLIFLFPWIKFFQLQKIFSLKAILANNIVVINDFLILLNDTFFLNISLFNSFKKRNKRLIKWIFLKKITSIKIKNHFFNINFLFFNTIFGFLFLFFFLKNFLIFNPEKLMLIYFLLLITSLITFFFFFIKNILITDMKKFIFQILEMETQGEEILLILWANLDKILITSYTDYKELFLTKNFQLKLIKNIKW